MILWKFAKISKNLKIIHSAAERRARHRAAKILHIKNDPKTIKKWIKIASKSFQNPGLEAPKSRSRGLRGRFGGIFGCLRPSRAFLEASWVVLEGFGRPLGPSWAEKGGQHGSKLLPKTEPKSMKNRYQNWSIFWCLLESIFGWILVYLGCQNGAKLAQKWDRKSMLTSKGEFSKNLVFPKEQPCFLRSRGSNNQEKLRQFDQKMKPRWG